MSRNRFFGKLLSLTVLCGSFILAAGPTASAQDVKAWQKALLQKIRDTQSYPRSAIARQLEGTAKVLITIDGQGVIKEYKVKQETGHSVLDRQIPRLMEKVGPLPAPPSKLLKNGSLSFNLPLVWRLG